MTTTTTTAAALTATDPSTRLRAALMAGRAADPELAGALIARCAVEPDFFVRDMLTWAVCRLPVGIVVPMLTAQLDSSVPQARAQALHTLSKIGDSSAWPRVRELIADTDDDVARSAWRAAVVVVPEGAEGELAEQLAGQLGRGDLDVHRSLSRALAGLGEAAQEVLSVASTSADHGVREHAEATERLRRDPDSGFAPSVEMAKRIASLGSAGQG